MSKTKVTPELKRKNIKLAWILVIFALAMLLLTLYQHS